MAELFEGHVFPAFEGSATLLDGCKLGAGWGLDRKAALEVVPPSLAQKLGCSGHGSY